ncbi:MAG: gamma-glutamyltransferase [Vicinamibacterales bacterium]
MPKRSSRTLERRGGLIDLDDFAQHTADWVEPLRARYRECDILEMPPSTQGFVALQMLNVLEGFDMRGMGHNSADALHLIAEAKKLAFADRGAYLADRQAMTPGLIGTLVSKAYADERRSAIDLGVAREYAPGLGHDGGRTPGFAGRDLGDTVYLTVADDRGNVVSLIQSLFAAFGAGIVAGDTGITLHNRGSGFTLAPGHANCIAPRKRPLHTLVPAMLLKDGRPWVSFGVMGGDNQAQAHAQVVVNLVDHAMDIQQAGEAARVRHLGDSLAVESGIETDVQTALRARGHALSDGRGQMGGFQGILIDPVSGVLSGGSDPRKDGAAIGY